MSDHHDDEFGDFKSTISNMLDTYGYEEVSGVGKENALRYVNCALLF